MVKKGCTDTNAKKNTKKQLKKHEKSHSYSAVSRMNQRRIMAETYMLSGFTVYYMRSVTSDRVPNIH